MDPHQQHHPLLTPVAAMQMMSSTPTAATRVIWFL
jgi:hypothetical protein